MNLAQLFYNKQAIKQSNRDSRFFKKRKSQYKALCDRNNFLIEPLEDRILLSADPLVEIVEPIEPSIVLTESALVSEKENSANTATNESSSALAEGPLLTVADATVLEGNSSFSPNLEFVVTLSEAAATDVMVSYQTINGTATEGVDFTQTANTLTIAAGDTDGLIAITTAGLTEVEADEYLILELTNVQGAQFAESALRARAFGTILDNDGGGNKLGLFVDDAQVVETDAGTHDAIFRVHLSQDPLSTVALNYTTVDGSASAGTDYQLTASTLNFTPGGTLTQEVRVPIFGDPVVEGSEQFSLVVTPTAAIANGATGAAGLGTILDDDTGGGLLPVLSLSEAEVRELNTSFSPTMEFVLTLSEAATTDVTLTYQTLSGTAKEEVDFDQVANTFTIVAGDTSGRLTLNTFGLSEIEPDEFFLLELTNVQGAVFEGGGLNLRAVGTLLDNDGTDNKLSLFVEDVQVVETDTGTREARFNVHLSQPSNAPITLSYTTADSSAVAGQDYQPTTGTVTFNPGETLKTVAVAVFGDLVGESSEHFSLVVTPTAAIANGATGAAGLGTILDDDTGGGLLPVLSLSEAEVRESNTSFSPTMEFVLTLSEAATTDVTLTYQTLSGTAKEGVDFVQVANTFTIVAGQTSGRLTLNTFGLSEIEPDEFFLLELTNVQGAVFAGGDPSLRAVGTLLDNDGTDNKLSLFVEDVQILEGPPGTESLATFNIYFSQPVDDLVTIDFTTAPGTASSGSDFTPLNGTLTFAPGQTRAAVQIPVIGDSSSEASETFSLVMSAPVGTTFAAGGAGLAATATIWDDDAGGGALPALSITDAEVQEGNGSFGPTMEFVLTLSAPTTNAVTVDFQTIDDTALAVEDYTARTGSVTFQPGQTSAIIDVTTRGLAVAEPDETFFLELSIPQNAVFAGGVATLQGLGTIFDNDNPPPLQTFPVVSVSGVTVSEQLGGTNAVFTLNIPSPAGLTITGDFVVFPGTATVGIDFTDNTGSFQIAVGTTSTTISVPIFDDLLPEDIETFVLQLTNLTNAQFPTNARTLYALEQILDDDPNLDIDGNGIAEADFDGQIILRYLFGLRGPALIDGVLAPDATRITPTVITKYLDDFKPVMLDVDGNATFSPMTDGLLILRFLDELDDQQLILGVVDPNGTRTTAEQIREHLSKFLTPKLPAIIETDMFSTDEDTPLIITGPGLLGNDQDPNRGPLTIIAVNGLTNYLNQPLVLFSGALLTVNADGSFQYDPNGQFEEMNSNEILFDTFSYTTEDSTGLSSIGKATISISGITDQITLPPVPNTTPLLMVADATVLEGNSSFSPNLEFVVTLSEAAATDVMVSYQTINGTATEGVDFTQTANTLTIAAGDTDGLIAITTAGLTEVEADEYLILELTNVQGAQFAESALRARAFGTILDNDGGGNKLGLFVDDAQVIETDAGTHDAIFRVHLSQDPTNTVALNYTTVDGSASAGTDYQLTASTLNFTPGGTLTQEVRVPIFGDPVVEGSEQFSLVVTPTAAIANGATGAAGLGTILDDDTGGGLLPVLSLSEAEVRESNTSFSPTMEFVLTLSEAATTDVTLTYQTLNGTAKEEVDFDQVANTFTIVAGDTSGRLTLNTFGLSEIEPDEFFLLELTNVQGAVFEGGGLNLRAVGTLLDNDGTDNKLSLFVEDVQVVETDTGTREARFNVHLSQPSNAPITLSYTTADSSAVAGQDYQPTTGTVTFNPGETLKTVGVAVFGDLVGESSEHFSLVVTPTAAIANGATGAAGLGTILDDDTGGGLLPVLSLSEAEVRESNTSFSPTMEFVLTLSEAATTDVTLTYQTLSGTAKEEVDFDQVANTFTIVAGDTSGRLTLNTFGLSEIEPDEFFLLELTNVQGAVFEGGGLNLRAVGTLLDNDGTDNKLSLFVEDVQVVETDTGTREARFNVHLSQPSNAPITLSYTTADGSAVAGQDYQPTTGTVTFNPGETLKTVAVAVFGDLVGESSEHFSLVVTPTAAIANGATGAAGLGTILDDDTGGGLLPVLSLSEAEVRESNTSFSPTMEFVLTLSEAATTDVTLTYQTLSGTAKEEVDFDQVANTFTIVAGDTSGRLTLNTFGLSEIEPDEFFLLELTNVQGAVFAGGDPSLRAVGTLLDNDGTDNKLSLFVEDVQILEGPPGTESLATFNIYFSQPVDDLVTIDFTTAPGTASSGSDFTPLNGTLTFAPGQTRAAVQIPVIGDSSSEASETFSLELSAPVGTTFAAGGAGLAATATIWDDDAGGGLSPALSITDAEVQEGNGSFGPNMEFVLTLSAPTTNTVTVDFQTIDDTALAVEDYTARTGSVTFQPGQTSAIIDVTTRGLAVAEPDETFFLELSNINNAAFAGGVATLQGLGTIFDNDSVPLTSNLTSSLFSEEPIDLQVGIIEDQVNTESGVQSSQESDLFVVQELLPGTDTSHRSAETTKVASSSILNNHNVPFADPYLNESQEEPISKLFTVPKLHKGHVQESLLLASTKANRELPFSSSPKWMEEFLVDGEIELEISITP